MDNPKTRPYIDLNMESVEKHENRVITLLDDDPQKIMRDQQIVGTVTTTYMGKAACGTPLATGKWKILREVYDSSTGISELVWAKGNGKYEHRWDQRASLTYL